MTRCAIYVRVSTAGQEQDGTSLDTQEEQCRTYAAERGWQVVAVYRETHTGSELWERPQMTALRETVRSSAVDVILAYALDRLSRTQTHVAIVAEECVRAGAQLAFVTEDFEQTSVGTFMRGAKAFAAELEREKIAERTQRGMLARVKGGKLRPGGRPLYGYRWTNEDKGAYVIDEEKATVVRRIYGMIATGRTLRSVTHALDSEGIPTANGAPHWSHGVIRGMVKHPGYAGVAVGNRVSLRRVSGKWQYRERPVSEHIPLPDGTIPPIVTTEVWEAAQAQLTRNKAEASRNNHDPQAFLLRGGFVQCAACGRNVRTMWYPASADAPPRPAYAVQRRSTNHPDCPACSISADTLDVAVWARVYALVLQPDVVMREMERIKTDDPTTADRAAVASLLGAIRRKRDNLTRALANIDDADVQAGVLSELKNVSQRVRELEAERDTLIQQRSGWQASRDQLDSLSVWLGTISENIDALTYQQKRDLLRALGVQVTLYPAAHTPRYTITASLPLDVQETSIVLPCD